MSLSTTLHERPVIPDPQPAFHLFFLLIYLCRTFRRHPERGVSPTALEKFHIKKSGLIYNKDQGADKLVMPCDGIFIKGFEMVN